jgi:hypothetical protein
MLFEPCACAGKPFPPRPFRRPFRVGAPIAVLAVVTLLVGAGAGCEAWEDQPPPATAASAASQPSPSAQAATNAAADPDAPLPPGGPIAPPAGAPPSAADDDARYASGEYAIGSDADSYDDNDPSALKDFREPLDPYGTWADDPKYGTVWVPAPGVVGPDFQPYVSAGHWAYDDDYVWVSDYPWGWAPFHYGRWIFIEGRGWSWIPGRAYRGAWVTWSVDDGYSYLGWAPMGPEFVWFGGAPVGWHGYWGPRWSYCPRGAVFEPRVGAHVVVGPAAVAIAGRMRPYAAADVRVGGPAPARLGYTAAQVPHAGAAVSVSRAQEFARPSTARPLGASPPARFEATPAANAGRSPVVTGAHPVAGASNAPRAYAGTPSVGRAQAAPARAPSVAPAPAVGAARPAPSGTFHGSGGSHGGGGHHR